MLEASVVRHRQQAITLSDWQNRLRLHFEELRRQRTATVGDKALFALEHGLESREVQELAAAVKARVIDAAPENEHALPWIVYAAELGIPLQRRRVLADVRGGDSWLGRPRRSLLDSELLPELPQDVRRREALRAMGGPFFDHLLADHSRHSASLIKATCSQCGHAWDFEMQHEKSIHEVNFDIYGCPTCHCVGHQRFTVLATDDSEPTQSQVGGAEG